MMGNYKKFNLFGVKLFPLFVTVAIVSAITYLFSGVKKKVDSILGLTSSGGTSDQDIKERQKEIKETVQVDVYNLPNHSSFYSSIADQLEAAMQNLGTDSQILFSLLSPLNVDELKAIYKAFGIRQNTYMIIGGYTGDLFTWFNEELSDLFETSNLKKMKLIWAKTKLWN